MDRRAFAATAVAVIALAGAGATATAGPPATWDDLVRVKGKRMQNVYLLPGADFRPYTKVMLDPTEVAFRKNWAREYNSRTTRGLSGRVTDEDVEQMVAEGGKAASEIFAQSFNAGGFPVVTAPGADVLRVRTAVINLTVTSPDKMTSGRSRTYSGEAGTATLIIEARDSVSGALLGRVVDSQVAGDSSIYMNRTRTSNRADFRALANDWAKNTVRGLQELRAASPVSG
jgi:hypothetical protein